MAAYENLASDLGEGYREHQPRDWARRGRVPVTDIGPLVNAAQKRGFPFVTHEFVVNLIADAVSASA